MFGANNTKLSCTVNTLEGRDAIQRDLKESNTWANANVMNFNKAKCIWVKTIPSKIQVVWRMN